VARRGVGAGIDYKWIALSNTTLGVLMAMINQSIILIALPNVFRGIHLDPLQPANTGYLLWMMMGSFVVTAVLVVSLGRLGDLYGRVRMYNLGFAVFTLFSLLLSVSWMRGGAGALWLILMRIGQGAGGAMLYANSAAIITDAFPVRQRGFALGINGIAAMSGSFIGLALGGLVAPVTWRLAFLVSVPVGVFGTVWAYRMLRELAPRQQARIDWWGNATFAAGLVALMVAITYGIQPYGDHRMGWTNPLVLALIAGGVVLLGLFVQVERHVADPMFRLELFRIRAFTAGNVATLFAAMARGGLQFAIVIWLQGIWLPLHGYAFIDTPFWAGLFMLPLVAGFVVSAPVSGYLSDRYGARPFATFGMALSTLSFLWFLRLPVDFWYPEFALVLFLEGVGMGLFSSPNRAAVMNSLPARERGAGGGMNSTFLNAASVLSVGVFFSLMVVGLSSKLPDALHHGLVQHGVANADAARIAQLPPGSTIFASFLGYNPVQTLLGPHVLGGLPPAQRHELTGRSFFPQLISSPFHTALLLAFGFAIVSCVLSALGSLARGPRYQAAECEPAEATVVTYESA
jgi:MFS family permease